jgi:hypothetical protein
VNSAASVAITEMNWRPRIRATFLRDGIGTRKTSRVSSRQYVRAKISASVSNKSAADFPLSFAAKRTLPATGEYGIAE